MRAYSDVIDFPVEIIGRAGAPRWCSFEEAVRVYRHRIAYAAEVPDALSNEIAHCKLRIRQLRLSWFRRHGWRLADDALLEGPLGEFLGEAAAFLDRSLPTAGLRQLPRRIAVQSIDHPLIIAVQVGESNDYRIELYCENVPPLHEFAHRNDVRAIHWDADCALVLRGPPIARWLKPEVEHDDWPQVVARVQAHDNEDALAQCLAILAREPNRLKAALTAGLVAVECGVDAADILDRSREFSPEHGGLAYLVGAMQRHTVCNRSAILRFEEALRSEPGWARARAHLVSALVRDGRWLAAWQRISVRPEPDWTTDDHRRDGDLHALAPWLFMGSWMRGIGLVTAGIGLWTTLLAGVEGGLPIVAGALVARLGKDLVSQRMGVIERHLGVNELRIGLLRWHRLLKILPTS